MIAPVELHGGWQVGKERILTVVSGEFGRRDEKPEAEVFVFDELGCEIKGYPYFAALMASWSSRIVCASCREKGRLR